MLNEDEVHLTYLFGEGVTCDLYEEAVCSLRKEGRHVDFRVLTEYVDQYETSGQTVKERRRPTCESVSRALQISELSEYGVRDILQRFENGLARRLEKARQG